MRGTLIVGALLLVGTSVAAQADVYRWVDAGGEVHYSDRWVPGSELIKIDRNKITPNALAAARAADQNRLAVSNDRIAARLQQSTDSQAVRRDVEQARSEQCKSAKERYDKSVQARRIFRTGKEGEREYLTDAEADEWRLQARSEMQRACGAATT
ncbi:MAG TPA: DUF4124 domain-containing protein [Steroidobacteraceae bacterium]|nr:DUF4124 domain-containing protein [Steroidobacteraceae bacterium]